MNNELISVIVPIYNVENYLNKCVASITGQTYSNIEVILVDDGSTDHSSAICDELKDKDQRIIVIHKENGGLSDARNAGLAVASGQWLSFVDSDDFLAPDTLQCLFDAAVQNQCQISVCNMVRIYEDDRTEPFYCPSDQLLLLPDLQRFETLKQPSACNKLFCRTLFEGVCFPKGKYYEDTFIYHILAHRARNIVLTGHDGYFYLSRRDSILGVPRYTDRYFDFIEAVYGRMTYLLDNRVPYYGEEACLSLYAAVSDAERFLTKTEANGERYDQMREWYRTAYQHLMKSKTVCIKQKVRLFLLRYVPAIHSRIY